MAVTSIPTIRKQCTEELCKLNPDHKEYFSDLEQRLFDISGKPQNASQICGYYRKYIQLIYNLTRHLDFLLQRYTPSELVHLDGVELNPNFKREIEESKKQTENYKNIQNLKIENEIDGKDEDDDEEEGGIICRKCKKPKKISVLLRQLRSGDESMSAFFYCGKCGYSWREG